MNSFRIISFDGGGIRGILTASIVKLILADRPNFLEKADAFAGTSTGGIIALGLAHGLDIQEIIDLYLNNAKKIFKDSFWDDLWDLGGVTGAQYNQDNLEKLLNKNFGDAKLKDLYKRVIIPTFKLYNEKHDSDPTVPATWYDKYYHNFEENNNDDEESVVRVALRTSAAPTYFPTCDGHIDGGVVFNNPTLPAIAQVLDTRGDLSKQYSLKDIKVVSIGTGTNPSFVNVKTYGEQKDWGYAAWVKPLINLQIDSNMGSSLFIAKQLLPEGNLFRMAPTLSRNIPMDTVKKKDLDLLVSSANSYYLEHKDEILSWVDSVWDWQ